jgi:hypothetical protein
MADNTTIPLDDFTDEEMLLMLDDGEEEKAFIKKGIEEREAFELSFDFFMDEEFPYIQATIDSRNKRGSFNQGGWYENPEIDQSVDRLCSELDINSQPDRYKKDQIFAVTKIVLINLQCARILRGEEYWLSYSRDINLINIPVRYRKSGFSHKYFIFVVDRLLELGYIANKKGFHDRKPFAGRSNSIVSRMKATDKLAGKYLAAFTDVYQSFTPHPKQEYIKMRAAKNALEIKPLIDYDDTAKTIKMRRILRDYNALLHQSDISHTDSNYKLRCAWGSKLVYRVFNNGKWSYGGRFYGGWWQSVIKKNDRKGITINGQPTIELDFKAFHPFMLYQMEGAEWADGFDPYTLPNYDNHPDKNKIRNLLKDMLLIWLNADDDSEAWGALEKAIKKDIATNGNRYPNDDDIIKIKNLKLLDKQFQDYNSPIAKHLFTGVGIELQNKDSQIAELIIKSMTAAGKPILCLHDSFICDSKYEAELRELMEHSYCKIMKVDVSPIITKE